MKKVLLSTFIGIIAISLALEHERTSLFPSSNTVGQHDSNSTISMKDSAQNTRRTPSNPPTYNKTPTDPVVEALALDVRTIRLPQNKNEETTQTESIPILIGTTTTTVREGAQKHTIIPLTTLGVSPVLETPAPYTWPAQSLTWGVFTGSNPSDIAEFERRVSKNPDYLAYFVHWANNNGKLPAWLSDVAKDKDRTLVLFWEASDYLIGGTDQPAYAYQTILRGDHDAYIKSFARQLKNYGGPIILIPFSELNGNWTPWSGTRNGNTPAEAVTAYRYIHDFFTHIPNVKFGLALNALSEPNTPANALSMYYPGDEYVDYVGIDGFNMINPDDPSLSFEELYGSGLKTIAQYHKPMFIFSMGTAEDAGKAAWLRDTFSKIASYPGLVGFIYFNQNKERNWLLWSDKNSLRVFEEFVASL